MRTIGVEADTGADIGRSISMFYVDLSMDVYRDREKEREREGERERERKREIEKEKERKRE